MVRARWPFHRVALATAFVLGTAAFAPGASGDDAKKEASPSLVDRVVVRWWSTDRGLVSKPQIIFARELALEARLEAMAGGEAPDSVLTDRYIRAALNRHIAESVLSLLPVDPPPTPEVIAERAGVAGQILESRVGGSERLAKACAIEGFSEDELAGLLRRSARASLYLDRMVAPEVEPTKQELLELQASGTTPYTKDPFDKVEEKLRRWAIARRLNDALDTFFQRSRSKLVVTWAVLK